MTIKTRNIADDAVTGAKIADDAIDSNHFAAGSIDAEHLSTTLKTGFIPIDLCSLQIIASNEIGDTGNFLDGNTAPEIKRINAATDKAVIINYIANGVEEISTGPIPLPPDIDSTADLTVKIRAKMAAGGMDTPTIAVAYFEGVGDTNAGGATGALSTTLATVSRAIAAADVGAAGACFTLTFTPGAHANEALEIHGIWVEYTRA